MSGQIQVREGWWRQRCGDVVRVVSFTAGIVRHHRCKSYSYDDSGRVHPDIDCHADLVEFLGEEIEVRRVR